MNIKFIDKERNAIICMDEFVHKNEYLNYFSIKLTINFDCFYAEKKIDIEVSEFVDMYNNIEIIRTYNKLNGFYLLQLDNYFKMHFINLNIDDIKIEVTLYSVNFIGELHFNFIMNKKDIFKLNAKIKDLINI